MPGLLNDVMLPDVDVPAFYAKLEAQRGLPPGYLMRAAMIESKNNPNAYNPGSKAAGLFQFVPSTAKRFGLSDPYDPEANATAAADYAKSNMGILSRALGRQPDGAELYLAHQQGEGGAAKLLSNPSAPAGMLTKASYIASNGGNPNAPAGEFIAKYRDKFNNAVEVPNEGDTAPGMAAAPSDPSKSMRDSGQEAAQYRNSILGGPIEPGGYKSDAAQEAFNERTKMADSPAPGAQETRYNGLLGPVLNGGQSPMQGGLLGGGGDIGSMLGMIGMALLSAKDRRRPLEMLPTLMQVDQQRQDRLAQQLYDRQRDSRDFSFRQTEAQRAQQNSDRGFGLQEKQVNQADQRDQRDFGFRQTEAGRQQQNSDRGFGLQEKEFGQRAITQDQQLGMERDRLKLQQDAAQNPNITPRADGSIIAIPKNGDGPVKEIAPAIKPLDTTNELKEYDAARKQGYQGTFLDYQKELKNAGATRVDVSTGGTPKLRETVDTDMGHDIAANRKAAKAAAAAMADLDVLDELGKMAPQGPVVGRLAQAFPGVSSAGAAYQAIIQRTAPTLHQPGTGSQSDIEFKGILAGLPSLGNKPEANAAISGVMRAKAQLDIQRGQIIDAWRSGKMKDEEMIGQIGDLDRRSIMTPELKSLLQATGGGMLDRNGGSSAAPAPGPDAVGRERKVIGNKTYYKQGNSWFEE